MNQALSPQFQALQELSEPFLALWTHRYDFIWAPHTNPGQRPQWQTEDRYPLGDRLLKQGASLFGVRFGPTTHYIMIDIDRHSPHHPWHNPAAIRRILATLEPLGLVTHLACTSSDSDGFHLYFPFQDPLPTWDLAACVTSLLENAGFKPVPGHLEVFPNAKPYQSDGTPSLYAAHRLPMQAGSYLLDSSWNLTLGDQDTFVHWWRFAQQKNDINAKTLKQLLKQSRRQHYRISTRADQFLNDLNAEIEPGWTSRGQTNRLLGKIATRSYVFSHVLYASQPLSGQDLVEDIVRIARDLPGFSDYCGHQHELEKRVQEWVRCVENSHYFPYGTQKGRYKARVKQDETPREPQPWDEVGWNAYQREGARARIQGAIADLLNQGTLPAGITERSRALMAHGIHKKTLYQHKDLWHPEYLWKPPPDPPDPEMPRAGESLRGASPAQSGTNFLWETGVTSAPCLGSSHFVPGDFSLTGVTSAPCLGSSHLEGRSDCSDERSQEAIAQIKQSLEQTRKEIKARLQAEQAAARAAREAERQAYWETRRVAHSNLMRQYLLSGEPVLIKEAQRWFAAQPEGADGLMGGLEQ